MQPSRSPWILTLVAGAGTRLTARNIAIARAASGGGDPETLSPDEAVDIPCPTEPDLRIVRGALAGEAVDALATRKRGRRKGLLVADMDSTIVVGETLDELAALAGTGDAVRAITQASMNGEIDFAAALRARVATLAGVDLGLLERTWAGVALMPGAHALVATMRAHGALCTLVSGGFTYFSDRVAALVGFDEARANVLLDDGQRLTGKAEEPILDRGAKRTALDVFAARRGLRKHATLAVGDGANDLDMIAAAGLGIAFRPKPVLAAVVANRVEHADLCALLFAQGYRRSEFVEMRQES